jgi:hypothetical protein
MSTYLLQQCAGSWDSIKKLPASFATFSSKIGEQTQKKDVVQKVCKIGRSCIDVVNICFSASYLPRCSQWFEKISDAINFSGFISIPKNLKEWDSSKSTARKLSDVVGIMVDLVVLPLYLQVWNINPLPLLQGAADKVRLGSLAQSFGQTKVSQWAGKQDLGSWTWGLCSVMFGLKFYDAFQTFRSAKSPDIKTKAHWDCLTSGMEFLLSGANFFRINNNVIISLTLVTKSIGLVKLYK